MRGARINEGWTFELGDSKRSEWNWLSKVETGIDQAHDRLGKVCLSLYHSFMAYVYRYIVER